MESRDSNEDIMFSVVGEHQENTSIYVDSVFESNSRQDDDSYEKMALDFEDQVVMATPNELRFPSSDEDSCSEILENGEIWINNEKDGQVEAISDEVIEVVVEMEDNMEYKKATDIITIEDDLLLEDDVAETTENEETVFVNATIEGANENEVKVKGNPHVQVPDEEKQIDCDDDDMIPRNCEGDLSNTTCPTNPIIIREIHQQMQRNNRQVVMGEEEEGYKVDCVDVVSMEEIHVNEVRETTPSQLINEEEEKEEVQERVTTEDELVKIEIEIPQTQVTEATKVDNNDTAVLVVVREEDPPRQLTYKQEKIEMTVEDEIPLVQPIQEEEEEVTEVSSDELQESLTPEAKMSNKNDTSDHTHNGTSIKHEEYKVGSKSDHKLWTWSIVVLIWCVCHWYSELPYYREFSLGSLFFVIILILLGYRNHRTTYLVKDD